MYSRASRWRKAKSTNATDTSFPSKIPTLTRPVNDGVHDIGPDGTSPRAIRIIGYALGDDDDVFECRLIGWSSAGVGAYKELWIPVPIASFIMTVGTSVGVVGGEVLNTERFADTIVAGTIAIEATLAADTTRAGTIAISSPANNLIGYADVNLGGFRLIEFTFDRTTGDPTSVNCLFQCL